MPWWLILALLLILVWRGSKYIHARKAGVLRFLFSPKQHSVGDGLILGFWPFVTWIEVDVREFTIPIPLTDLFSPLENREGKLQRWALVHLSGALTAVVRTCDPFLTLNVKEDELEKIALARVSAIIRSDFMLKPLAEAMDDKEQRAIVRRAIDPINDGTDAELGLRARGLEVVNLELTLLKPQDERIDRAIQGLANELFQQPGEVTEGATDRQVAEAKVAAALGLGDDVDAARGILMDPDHGLHARATEIMDFWLLKTAELRFQREAAAAGNMFLMGGVPGSLFAQPLRGKKTPETPKR